MRVVGYVRVSTDEQAKEGVSLDAQRTRLAAYAVARRLDLAGFEEDAGVSAKSLQRPGLARALARLESGEAEGLLVAKLDRLTRSVVDLQTLVTSHFGEAGGAQLLSLSESVDTRKANGRMLLNLMISVAQWEREIICERTAEALAHKRGRGERVGTVPYGFRVVDDGRRSKSGRPAALEVDEGEAAGLALVAELHSKHKSLREIAAALQAGGFPTRSGRPWRHSTIQRILQRVQA